MDSTYPETPTSDRSKAIRELLKGRDVATLLKTAFHTHTHVTDDQSSMLNQILNSFSNCLSLLSKVSDDPDEVSQFPANTHCWDACQKSEGSGESIKSTAALKERRGCYKRRKTAHSWSKDTSDLVDDGHQWRKYGQKSILNAQFPRNYFRCTHKLDQLCRATKQVQRISEDPPLYRTTYCGHHTCKNPQFVITHHPSDSSNLISFTATTAAAAATINPPCKQESNPVFQSCSPTVKQECSSNNNETNHHDRLTSHNNQSLSSENLLSNELWHGFDHGDVISSCTTTTTTSASTHNSLDDISFMVECGEFDYDVLQYDFL